jgi:hypothetical protein
MSLHAAVLFQVTPTPNPSPQGGGGLCSRSLGVAVWHEMALSQVPLPLEGRG